MSDRPIEDFAGSHIRSWRLTGPLPLREWDGDFVVFSPLSGHTHFLDIVSGELLKRLTSGGTRESELCALLSAFLEVPNDAAFAAEIGVILARLDDLGLVAPAD